MLALLGGLLTLVGGIASLVGSILVLIKAFQKSVLWGLGSLFIPFVILVFVFLNWEDSKKGFLISVAGFGLIVLGSILAAMGMPSGAAPPVAP